MFIPTTMEIFMSHVVFAQDVIGGLEKVINEHSNNPDQVYWIFYGSTLPDHLVSSYEGYLSWKRGTVRKALKSYMSQRHPDVKYKIYISGGRPRWRTGRMTIKFK